MRYDMRKHLFSERIIDMPINVVSACTVNEIKNKINAYWCEQEMMYNYRAEITATGSRSFAQ